jgi:queuine tRNA-ribosyltransferase
MNFKLLKTSEGCGARAGIIETGHGIIETPVFMPVGTAGTVKAVHQRELKDDLNAMIILGNTYHLYLRPGVDIIGEAGGLHKFINWDRPILTDSGGYQVFSLAERRKLSEQGALFSSHIDGSRHHFTPENIVDIQRQIGADIIMALDECTGYPADHKTARESAALTHQWLKRGYERFINTSPLYGYHQSFFPIVQGSTYPDLRKASSEEISSYETDGYAIGGLSVGEPVSQMYDMIGICAGILPHDKPRYLMGVGTPQNLIDAISLGIDMFAWVFPTRTPQWYAFHK